MWSRNSISTLLCVPALAAGSPVDMAGKLDPSLRALYDAWKARGGRGLRSEAAARRISLRSGRVAVRIATTADAEEYALRKAACRGGGRVITTEGSSLFAEVPVSRLSQLAAHLTVLAVYLDRPEHRSQIDKE